MATTIFLHIGIYKTGTTAIQGFFNQQRILFKKQGLLYPTVACSKTGVHRKLGIALGFKQNKQKAPDVQALRKALQNEIKKSGAAKVLMSAENFFGISSSIQPVRSFFADYDVKIVIYLRRHDSWWESSYNQASKMHRTPPWDANLQAYIAYMKKNNPNYRSYRVFVDQWAEVFGKENIIVRPYELQQNQPDIIDDFLQAIGFSSLIPELTTFPKRINESLPFFTLRLIDIYNRANINAAIRTRLMAHAKSVAKKDEAGFMSSPAFRRQLVIENSQDYEYIAKEYLCREDGRLFYDPLPNLEDDWVEPKSPTAIEIVEHTVQAMQQVNIRHRLMGLCKQWLN